jgi:uncharacterized protein (DUF2336 family)
MSIASAIPDMPIAPPLAERALTPGDIEQLITERSGFVRSEVAEKICRDFNANLLTPQERDIATDIFRLLMRDAELRVRKTLANALKDNLSAPHDVVVALAKDSLEVAAPILEHSFVLTEQDLMSIVSAAKELGYMQAIAKRETLSKPLSHALIETRENKVIEQVVLNRGAALSDTSLAMLLKDHGRNQSIMESLVMRGGLPHSFAERLFSAVSDNLKKQLSKRYRFSAPAESPVRAARETATLQFLSPWMSEQNIVELVREIDRNKRLKSSMIIRSLCIGDLRFFEVAMAQLAGVPVSNARLLMLDPGPLGFKALYDSARMPEEYLEAVKVMLHIALSETEYGEYRASDFCQRMIERITAEGHDKSVPSMNILMTMIARAMHDGRTLH